MMVYAPNRNTGLNDDPRGDAIAVFAFDGIEFLHFRQDASGGLVEGESVQEPLETTDFAKGDHQGVGCGEHTFGFWSRYSTKPEM